MTCKQKCKNIEYDIPRLNLDEFPLYIILLSSHKRFLTVCEQQDYKTLYRDAHCLL